MEQPRNRNIYNRHRRERRSTGSAAGNKVPSSTNVFSASLKNCKSSASGWAPFPSPLPPNSEARPSPKTPPPPPPPAPPFSKKLKAFRNSLGVVATLLARWQGITRRNGHFATLSAQSRTGSGSRLSRSTCRIGATSRPPCPSHRVVNQSDSCIRQVQLFPQSRF